MSWVKIIANSDKRAHKLAPSIMQMLNRLVITKNCF